MGRTQILDNSNPTILDLLLSRPGFVIWIHMIGLVVESRILLLCGIVVSTICQPREYNPIPSSFIGVIEHRCLIFTLIRYSSLIKISLPEFLILIFQKINVSTNCALFYFVDLPLKQRKRIQNQFLYPSSEKEYVIREYPSHKSFFTTKIWICDSNKFLPQDLDSWFDSFFLFFADSHL